MAAFKIFKKREWWREDGEVVGSERRMTEDGKTKYTLKRGSDGKNTGSISSKLPNKKAKKAVKEAEDYEDKDYEDEDENYDIDDTDMVDSDMDDMDDTEDDNAEINDEDDAIEKSTTFSGSVCTCPACGAKLVIEPMDDESEEDEEDEGNEYSDEDMLDDESDLGLDTESDERDLTPPNEEDEDGVPKLESTKQSKYQKESKISKPSKRTISKAEEEFEKAYQEWKAERRKRIENAKAKKNRKSEETSENGVEYGTATSDMVGNGASSSGSKIKASSGDDNDFDFSSSATSDMVGGGTPSSGSKIKVSNDDGVDPNSAEMDLNDMDYGNLPLEVGADPASITRYKAVEARRKARSTGLDESTHLEEKFDFKKLIKGQYK